MIIGSAVLRASIINLSFYRKVQGDSTGERIGGPGNSFLRIQFWESVAWVKSMGAWISVQNTLVCLMRLTGALQFVALEIIPLSDKPPFCKNLRDNISTILA